MIDYSKIPEYTRHGGAYDRGASDRYYGRRFSPHVRVFENDRLTETLMDGELTEADRAAYKQGYETEIDEKDWGNYLIGRDSAGEGI